ncbi:hypothetical protein BC830DRAFT_881354 [Chytriomyces sp. MP71]|nr:hypothetical protein BC830DRAFT_881354 [Chytriomyces sp. MP71]
MWRSWRQDGRSADFRARALLPPSPTPMPGMRRPSPSHAICLQPPACRTRSCRISPRSSALSTQISTTTALA